MLRTYRPTLAFLAILAAAFVNPGPARADDDDKGFVKLFDGKSLEGWKTILQNGKEDDNNTFTVKDGAIVVKGSPAGYFYTAKSYKNYILRYDWKFIKDGNSGLLVHITGKHAVWPKSIEVQGYQKDHGHIFAIQGAKGTFKTNRDNQKKAIKIGEWNTTEVVCKDGSITTTINGLEISTGKGDLTEGPFGFQSEGTELHFKNIRIKELGTSGASGAVQTRTVALAALRTTDDNDKSWTMLFNGKNLDGLKFFFDPNAKDADPEKTFVVKDGVLQVSGFPNGYFYTAKSYKNYVLRYDWTYPKEQPEKTTMNSGCLVHIQEPHKIWPHSVEPQVRYMDHGKFFFIGFAKGAKTEQDFDEAAQKKALKPHYEWNSTEVTCKSDGGITVKINGIPVNSGKSELTSGPIGFQSEGAIIHYKNIKLKALE